MDDRESPLGTGLSLRAGALAGAALSGFFAVKFLVLIGFVALIDPHFLFTTYRLALGLPGELWAWFSTTLWAQAWYVICCVIGYYSSPILSLEDEEAHINGQISEEARFGEVDTSYEQELTPELTLRQLVQLGFVAPRNFSDCVKRVVLATFCYAPAYFVLIPIAITLGMLVLGMLILLIGVLLGGVCLYISWLLGY